MQQQKKQFDFVKDFPSSLEVWKRLNSSPISFYIDIVKKIRQDLNLSQVEMANYLGISFATLNRWENNWCPPSKLGKRSIIRVVLKYYNARIKHADAYEAYFHHSMLVV